MGQNRPHLSARSRQNHRPAEHYRGGAAQARFNVAEMVGIEDLLRYGNVHKRQVENSTTGTYPYVHRF